MGGAELGTCGTIGRVLLVNINLIFAAVAITAIGIGSWLINQNEDFAFVTGNNIISGGALLIVAGCVTVVITAIGIIGAIFKLRPLLLIYAAIVAIIVILEIVAGILGFVFRDSVLETVEERSLDAIREYNINPEAASQDARRAVDFFQEAFSCCGYNNASDWFINPNILEILQNFDNQPPGESCQTCDSTASDCTQYINGTIRFNATNVGCSEGIRERATLLASVGGGIGIVFGLLEIVGVIIALLLCCCISHARRQEIV